MGTQTLSDEKLELIVQISKLDDEDSVYKVKSFIEHLNKKTFKNKSDLLQKLAKPMRKKLDLEELKREQNWKPIDRKKFDRLVKEIDIQEPLEQLLADI